LSKSKGRILITDFIHQLFIEDMQADGWEIDYQPEITQEGVENIIERYHGIVINSRTKIYRPQIEIGRKLKFIARIGSGMEIVDTEFAASRNIICISAPEGNRDAVGEHALGMTLSLLNNLPVANNEVKQGKWLREENRGRELGGKTIGLLGFGNTGQAFAEKLKGFNVNVLAYDKYKLEFSRDHIKKCSLEDIFEEADLLSIHLPLTNETNGWIDIQFLMRFKKDIYLINTARGKIIRTSDLLRAIKSGKIKGAALDVLENEAIGSLPDEDTEWFEKLIQERKVLLTPHIAGWTIESKKKIAEILVTKIKKHVVFHLEDS